MASSERVGIELDLIGRDAVMSDLQRLDRMVRTVTGKHAIQLDLGRTKEEMIAVNSELEKYRRLRDDAEKGSKEYDDAAKKVKELSREYKELSIRAQEYSRVLREHKSFGQVYDGIRAKVKQLGSALTSTGQAMKLFSRPFNSLMRGTVLGAGYKLLNVATSGLSGAFERYDTFKTYAKSLEALGYDAEKKFAIGAGEAMTAIENLNESVLGLPTGLDEIVAAQKKYLAASGDMVTATMAAIAANNTFLAQGSDAKDQLRGARQLRNLLSGGEMTKARWQSILESMPLAVKAVGEELGYTDKNMDEFRKSLLEGEIAADDFLKAFLEVGTSGKIKAATDEMKHTFGAVSANIGNAFKRMGENVIKTLDDVLMKATGKDTIDLLLDFKGVIDSFSEGVQSWIKAHPDVILNFIEALKKIDFASFFKGVGDGLATSLEYATKLIDLLGGRGLSVIGKLMTYSGFISTPLTIIGGFLRGIGSIAVGLFGATVTKGIERLGGGGGGLLGGILTKIFGKKGAGEIAKEAASAPKALDTMKNVFSKLQGVLTAAGEIAIISGTAWFSAKTIKSAVSDFKDIVNILGEIDYEGAKNALAGISAMFVGGGVVGTMIGKVGKKAGLEALAGTAIGALITMILSLASAVDMAYLKQAVTDFRDTVNMFDEIRSALDEFDVGALRALVGKATEVTTAMNDIRTELTGEANKEGGKEGIKALPKKVKQGVKDIFEVLDTLLSSVDLINSLNSAEIDISNLGTNSGSLTNAIDAIGKIIDELPQAFQNGAASELSGEVLTTVKNFNNVFTHIKIMMGSLQEAFKVLSPTANPNAVPMFTFKQRLEDMFNDMSGIVSSYDRARIGNTAVLKTKMENLADAFEDIKRIMTKLQQMQAIKLEAGTKKGGSLFKSMQTINDLMTDLGNAFAPEIVNGLNGNIQTFVTAVDEMFAAIDRLTMGENGTGAIDISIKFNPDISGLAATIGAIRAANRRIASAVRAIKTEYSKTINVKIRANVNTSGAVSAISGGASLVKSAAEGAIEKVNQSRGGYTSRHGVLYRSGGGSVFRPRGTDKIPAMLTEGEYVHRKQAVDTFGIDFMRKVNNLDIRGAMNALLARGGMSASIGRQSIINNTVNNNQRVTQNINTNNPQFARIRASRFAGAL